MTDAAESKPKKPSRPRLMQSRFPRVSLEDASLVARAIVEQYGGMPTAPHDVALALNISPTGNKWRYLSGASVAYGLTEGAYKVQLISLTPLGQQLIAPATPAGGDLAKKQAILQPSIMGDFYSRYDRSNFPDDRIAETVLTALGVPSDRTSASVDLLKRNGEFADILRPNKSGGFFVAVDIPEAIETAPEKKEPSKEVAVAEAGSSAPRMPQQLDVRQDAEERRVKVRAKPDVYINLEVHIAADTPLDTIETVFKNMRKYLIDDE